jgi:hypothetical protein
MKPKTFDAIRAICPTSKFVIANDGEIISSKLKNGETLPTESEVNTKLDELISDFDAQAYARARQPLYPDIGDQLDDLYHKGAFSAEMKAKIKKVKDDNPKPE